MHELDVEEGQAQIEIHCNQVKDRNPVQELRI
jgi:hypothetical protein